jgi:hypothetical protein
VIGPTGAVRVMIATKPVDFRKGAEGLAALVRAPGAGEYLGSHTSTRIGTKERWLKQSTFFLGQLLTCCVVGRRQEADLGG